VNSRKKLIEVALPLEAINIASAREKSIRHGHPSTLHLWWARRPLAAARAVIFAQMVDDPSVYVGVLRSDPKLRRKAESVRKARLKLWEEARALSEKSKGSGLSVPEPAPAPTLDDVLVDQERQRLFRIIEDLVLWENTTNDTVLQAARDEIWQSWRRACAENADHPRAKELFDRNRLPAFHDPFAGGGALPLEAQRLGLESYASDLNPVAVLINKAMIEIPPKFTGKPPVNPEARSDIARSGGWHGKGAAGLAEDVRYYGRWMRDEAEKRIGHLYPKIDVTAEMTKSRPDLRKYAGKKLTVIAWLWARTVKSPNPAFANVDVPLASTFMLSTKAGTEAYVEPVIEGGGYSFTVKIGKPKDEAAADRGTRAGKAQDFLCLMSGVPVPRGYIRDEGKAGRLGTRLMAIVAEGDRGRVYLPPSQVAKPIARGSAEETMSNEARASFLSGSTPTRAMITGGVCSAYGLTTWGDLFTDRQIVALTTLANFIKDTRDRVKRDAVLAGLTDDNQSLHIGGDGATAYGDAVAVYLSFAVSKAVDRNTSLCFWERPMNRLRGTFGRQALPMVWDFAETNPFAGAGGDFYGTAHSLSEVLDQFVLTVPAGTAGQADARTQSQSDSKIVSCDPPYYDNIGYADLSDFFYVWLRRSLSQVFPDLFSTVVAPKEGELVATRFRHGGKDEAEEFFLNGMTEAIHRLAQQAHRAFPVTIYYAFKQSERAVNEGSASTGWDTFLDAVIRSGFTITGTWPVRTEQLAGLKDSINALASSIVLVCRHRAQDTITATRREFIATLKTELPQALANLQRGNIAPVDLAQAAIGPGMAVYTRYSRVLDAEGRPLSVRQALALINQTLDEALTEQEGDFDADSRWAVTWFEQSGFAEGEYGVAEQLSKSKNTSVAGMAEAGILESRRGKVRLLRPQELSDDWNPLADTRLTAWEIVHHLVRVLASGGESAAAELVASLGAKADMARELAYRLYTLCERKKRAAEALAYNGLVQSWPEITRLARESSKLTTEQGGLFGDTEVS
jgi:putative DNA methylase